MLVVELEVWWLGEEGGRNTVLLHIWLEAGPRLTGVVTVTCSRVTADYYPQCRPLSSPPPPPHHHLQLLHHPQDCAGSGGVWCCTDLVLRPPGVGDYMWGVSSDQSCPPHRTLSQYSLHWLVSLPERTVASSCLAAAVTARCGLWSQP